MKKYIAEEGLRVGFQGEVFIEEDGVILLPDEYIEFLSKLGVKRDFKEFVDEEVKEPIKTEVKKVEVKATAKPSSKPKTGVKK